MKKTICQAKKKGEVKRRGRASIEWIGEDGTPYYYCYGYVDQDAELLSVCKNCRDNVIFAQEDFETIFGGMKI